MAHTSGGDVQSAKTELDRLERMVATVANLLQSSAEESVRAHEAIKGAFDANVLKQVRANIERMISKPGQLFRMGAMSRAINQLKQDAELLTSTLGLAFLGPAFDAEAMQEFKQNTERLHSTLGREVQMDVNVLAISKICMLNLTIEEAEKYWQLLRSTLCMSLEHLGALIPKFPTVETEASVNRGQQAGWHSL